MKKLRLPQSLTGSALKYAVEAALLLGFQSETAVFPVISADGEITVPTSAEELLALWTLESGKLPDGYQPAIKQGPLYELDFRKKRGLENLFSRGMFLKDNDFDFLPDQLDVKLILPENTDFSILTAACNLAFRFGMETTAYEGGILADSSYMGNAVIFEYADQAGLFLEEVPDAIRVHLRGSGSALEDFSSLLCEKFPLAGGSWRTWRDVLMELADAFSLRTGDGQLAYLHALQRETPGNYTLYGSPEITGQQKDSFPHAEILNAKSGQKIYDVTYQLPWEVDTFENILQENVYPMLHTGDRVRIEGALCEDKTVRQELAGRIAQAVMQRGAKPDHVQIICAYKQGFSWIDESLIPEISRHSPVRIEILFKPFLPDGQTEWVDENGALPSSGNLNANDPDKWYDLPIRFLQELYPIQDILTEKLNIQREGIQFSVYEGNEDLTYLCRVTDAGGTVREFRYLAEYSERPYLDEYPQLGKVHPSAGYIRVWINREEKVNCRIKTDLENIWDIYQSKVLPECRTYIENITHGEVRADQQPFFQTLLLEPSLSAPDYRIGCREDLFSPLDALHEDLYFVGSDYFKNYGMQAANTVLDAPGLILPKIHNRSGAPSFRAALYKPLEKEECILRDGEKIVRRKERDTVSARISAIHGIAGKLVLTIQTEGVPYGVLESYAKLFSEGILESSQTLSSLYALRFTGENGAVYEEADVPPRAVPERKKITEIDLHENELIGYDTYLEIMEELKAADDIEVFRTARSYSGREVYAIWLKPEYEGYLSMTKRLTRCSSETINARHHANEVSSTNATFILLKRLLTEERWRGAAQNLNLVLTPMENPDGAAIHDALQQEHPYWKFHVARFNALGKEFSREYFKQDTIHTEALGFSRLFEKYLPDIAVDNHGVPSHEWEQQFSGYTSPSYKGFWLPRSLLYGYFWYVSNPEYRSNYHVNKVMEDVIADRIAEDDEMSKWNQEWSAQFETYAHSWMPKLFPADYYKDMINYWIPIAFDVNRQYPSIRFPWITTVSYTSETADETAQGEYLNLCARAHAAHDEATIQMILQAKHLHTCQCTIQNGRLTAEYIKLRPMIAE